ncbi:MAG: MBL fold metallo-hydrolase [Verrucomicrobia bacterium]|nr:MBL fold metallo-hydrolase [Verrucomicrobiota bacterium]MBU6446040.1 MBL fold metallo-hydrolase [Verrucomicrobiota bacterium]MDE3048075.1 MBL fold metallo-hydrolase [Verrucomicrobiota bacterium]
MRRIRFKNAHIEHLRRNILDVVLWKTGCYDDPHPKLPPPASFCYPASPKLLNQEEPKAVWIGHSTYLIEVGGLAILTDPVWDSYCSPIPLRSLKRITEPAIALSDLPPIDFVLISHNHYDHLDAKTVAILHRFHPQIQWIVPEGLSPWFTKRGIANVVELSWWKEFGTPQCTLTAVPAQHFSGRTLWDQNRTHWNGYVIQAAHKQLYFTGDTGYNEKDFKEIGQRFRSFDLSLIPIGTYVPKKFMQPVHVSPREAVQIHQDVHSNLSLGMHWNTFRLSDEPDDRPPYDLYLAMREKKLPFETFLPVEIGTYVNF